MSDESHEPAERRADRAVPWWLLTGAGLLTQVLAMASGVITARMLGVEGRGQLYLVSTVGGLASQLTLGGSLPNAITKQLAERGVTARDGLRGMTRRWLPIGLTAGILAAGYFLFLEWDRRGIDTYLLTLAVLLMALQSMASRIMMGAMLGEGAKPMHIALTGVLPQATVVLVMGTALALGLPWDAVEVTWISIACTVLVLLLRLRVLAPRQAGPEAQLDGDELARLARRTHIGSVGPIDGLSIDRLLVGTLLGTASLGLYSAAVAFISLSNIFAVSMAMLALPRVAMLQRDRDAEKRYVRNTLLLSFVLLGLVVGVLEVLIGPLIRIAFGEEFVGATECARWVILASGFLGFRRVMIGILQGRDRGRLTSVVELTLTPLLVAGVVVASARNSLVLVGITMTVVGAVGCVVFGLAVLGSAPRAVPRGGRHRREKTSGPAPRH